MEESLPTVAIDVTPLVGRRTGIGVAVEEMVTALGRRGDGQPIVPYALGLRIPPDGGGTPPGTRIVRVPTRALLLAWARADRPRFDRLLRPAALVHGTNFVVPPTRLPALATVHDCTFARFPGWVTPTVRSFGRILRRAVARGAWVHCTTRTVAAEVEELFEPVRRGDSRVVVVPFGVPGLGAAGPLPPALASRLRGAPYVLALGTVEPRKNLPRLVRAFGELASAHPDLRLVLAGPDGPDRPALDRAVAALPPAVRGRVVRLGWVEPSHRRPLIEGAEALAYPSLYEGFGFPMLEAMALGIPVVAGRAGALPEVAGEAAMLVDPTDPAALASALHVVLTDRERRARLVAEGRARAASFTWEACAQGLVGAYRELAATAASTSS